MWFNQFCRLSRPLVDSADHHNFLHIFLKVQSLLQTQQTIGRLSRPLRFSRHIFCGSISFVDSADHQQTQQTIMIFRTYFQWFTQFCRLSRPLVDSADHEDFQVARLIRYRAPLPSHLAPLRVTLFGINEIESYSLRNNFIFYIINLCLTLVLMRLKCSNCIAWFIK